MYSITYYWVGQDKRASIVENFKIAAENEHDAVILIKSKLPHVIILEVHSV